MLQLSRSFNHNKLNHLITSPVIKWSVLPFEIQTGFQMPFEICISLVIEWFLYSEVRFRIPTVFNKVVLSVKLTTKPVCAVRVFIYHLTQLWYAFRQGRLTFFINALNWGKCAKVQNKCNTVNVRYPDKSGYRMVHFRLNQIWITGRPFNNWTSYIWTARLDHFIIKKIFVWPFSL
jgi:hypothetical protein